MEKLPQIAVRIITIKEGKVLLVNNIRDNFYYFVGGKVNFGESLEDCAQREIREETGLNVNLTLKKILYIQELIKPAKDKHKFEIFILANIDLFLEIEGVLDPEHGGSDHLTWVSLDNLPQKLLPTEVALILQKDYTANFANSNIAHFVSKE